MLPSAITQGEIQILLERFRNSKAFSGLTEIDRAKISDSLLAGNEKAFLAVKKIIDDDDETRKYLYDLVEQSIDNGTKLIIKAFKAKKLLRDEEKDNAESQIAAEALIKELSL